MLADVYFTVADLADGNVVLNTDGGPGGVGAEVLVPDIALGDNGLLDANESFTLGFDVGLAVADSFALTVDANGEPWDWTPDADPAPSYNANDTSFVFTNSSSNAIFLPMMSTKQVIAKIVAIGWHCWNGSPEQSSMCVLDGLRELLWQLASQWTTV